MEHSGKINPTKSDLSARIFIVGYPPVELKGKCMLCLFSNPDTNYQKNIFSIKGISACYALFSNPDTNYQKNIFSIKGISACYALFLNPYTLILKERA